MCGVVTVVGVDAGARAQAIVERLRHRGPDGQGLHVTDGGRIALGHARLAIVDIEGGAQPLYDEKHEIVVVANGQIYNEADLRADLIARGHVMATASDCEVIAHLYEEFGVEMLARLDGMFAFALFDRPRKRILIARDRLGIKPLAYAARPGAALVASEVAALLGDPQIQARLDPQALESYLMLGYVPAPQSIITGVAKLPPGTYAWIDENGAIDGPHTWWRPPLAQPDCAAPADLHERVESLLASSVALRLRADVPLGIFLSGGIDSALIAAMAVRAGARPPAYCLGFEGELAGWDERPQAREVARKLGLELREVIASSAQIDRLPELAARQDEPFADSSALLLDHLVAAARPEIKVALSGEGGDELFGGYPRHRAAALAAHYDFLPRPLRRMLAKLGELATQPSPQKLSRWRLAMRFLAAGALAPDLRMLRWQTLFPCEMRRLVAPDLIRTSATKFGAESSAELRALAGLRDAPAEAVARALFFDLVGYLPGDLLVKADRVGLGRALEIRTPMLSVHLVEFAAALPGRVRLPSRISKPILRDLARKHFGTTIANAPKGGFSLPMGTWLRAGRLKGHAALLEPAAISAACPFLDAGAIGRLHADHQAGRADHGARLHALAALVGWFLAHPTDI